MTQEVVDKLLDPIQTEVFTSRAAGPFIFWCQSGSPRWPWKTFIFQACHQGRKVRKKYKASKKHQNSPRNTFLTKTLFWELQLSMIPFKRSMQKVAWKQAQKKHRLSPIETQKPFKMRSQNHPHVSFLLLPWSPGCPHADEMAPRVVKRKHQACQMKGFRHPK